MAKGLGDDADRGALLLGGPGYEVSVGRRRGSSFFAGGSVALSSAGRRTTGAAGGATTTGGTREPEETWRTYQREN